MENSALERRSSQVVVTEIIVVGVYRFKALYLKFSIAAKKRDHLLFFLTARIWSLFFSLFGKFLFQAALTIAVQLWFTPVFAKVFSYEILVCVILRHYHYLVKGL